MHGQRHQRAQLRPLHGRVAEGQRRRRGADYQRGHLLEALRTEGDKFAAFLELFPDEALAEHVQYPPGMQPPSKSRFELLLSTKEHEMHHRGQLMLIERMVGITPHLTRQMQERMAEITQAQKA